MASFRTEVSHQLGKEPATDRLKTFLDQVGERYKDQVSHLDGEWNDNVLTFALTTFGFKIDGVLTVEEEVATLEGKLPFAALAFRGKIEGGIAKEFERALR